ncbi:N-acetylmuramoyl-L-alanine amidase AmiA, partial [Escherichia coli]|nr:N-acetylmuramoyl-L-alanine amidase AmiA [Escherichia coli]
MIDPGHGGIDSGAVGHQGALEKHVVLEIANNVKNLLK